jgi:hypothetical protein
MQLVSAAARKTFSDAPAARPPNETMTGQRLSFGGRSTLAPPAPTNRTVASQPKVGRRAAAGTTAAPEVRLRQRAEATRHPRARPTEAQVRHFDPARRNPYAQGTGPLAPDNAASAPAGHAAGPRVTPSAIRDEPTVENQTTDLARAHPTAAQLGHFETPRRNPYAQRTGPLAPSNAAPARRAAGPRATPPALRHQPTPGNRTTGLPHACATRTQVGHFDPARRNPYAQRTRSLAPAEAASKHQPAGPRMTQSAIRPKSAMAGRATNLSQGQPPPTASSPTPPAATRAPRGHRRFPPGNIASVSPLPAARPRATPSARPDTSQASAASRRCLPQSCGAAAHFMLHGPI